MKNLRRIATDIANADIKVSEEFSTEESLSALFKIIAQNRDMRLYPSFRYVLHKEDWYEPDVNGDWHRCGKTYVLFNTINGNYYFAHDLVSESLKNYVVTEK